jgi:WD40 repeat protein
VPIGQPLQRGSPEEVNRTVSLAFSPDSSVLASGNIYGSITIWDLMTSPPKPVGEPLGASNASVESLSFHPDEMRLASGYYDGNVVIWNLGDSPWTQVGERLESGFGMIKSLAFSPDGLTLASGHYDGPVLLWDLTASSPSYRMLGGLARSLAFSHDGTKLATVSWNDSAKLWDLTAFPLSPEPYQALESPGEPSVPPRREHPGYWRWRRQHCCMEFSRRAGNTSQPNHTPAYGTGDKH